MALPALPLSNDVATTRPQMGWTIQWCDGWHILGGKDPSTTVAAQELTSLMEMCGIAGMISQVHAAPVTHMIRPSSLFGYIHMQGSGLSKRLLGADEGVLEAFWRDYRSSPVGKHRVRQHNLLKNIPEADPSWKH